MVDKNTFMETLHGVQEIARTSTEPMDRETVLSYFKDMELSEEQEELVYQFLMLPEEQRQAQGETEEGEKTLEEAEREGGQSRAEQSGESKPDVESEMPHSSHFQMYLDEIDELTELEQAAEEVLYQKLLAGNTSVIETITTQWLKRIVAIAEEFKGRGCPVDDLVQEGNMGLLLALNVLSKNQQEGGNSKVTAAKVPALLKGTIRESMEQYLGEETGENQQSEAVLNKVALVHQAREFLTREKGETPSLRELSDYTRIPAEEISDILSLVKEQK